MGEGRLEVDLKGLRLNTPLLTASGTSGSGNEADGLRKSEQIVDSLGAFVTKGVTLRPKPGNPKLRVLETRNGLLNSIGLQNKGVERFILEDLPKLLVYELPIIVNISADTVEEFGILAERLLNKDVNNLISGLEINVSCPNLKKGGIAFGCDPGAVERVVSEVRSRVPSGILLMTKLTPNVTDITTTAKAAIAGGTDVLSMINTVRGMAISIETRHPYFQNIVAGLSGPAIKPIGLYNVYQCFSKIGECRNRKIPIVGIGGISTWQDALEYILAGSTAVGIGTAWFVWPEVFPEIKRGLLKYLKKQNIERIKDLIGYAHS
ncbi:MAG: dihydroorotate dehydrogenase [Candidatus Krumholzibacteriia bacterium]